MTYIRTTYSPTNTSQNLVSTFFSSEEKTCSGEYRSGFNGKENIEEIDGWQDYGERMYNRLIGRFPTADPLIVYKQQYPELSSYQFASNTPIQAIDLDGLEGQWAAGIFLADGSLYNGSYAIQPHTDEQRKSQQQWSKDQANGTIEGDAFLAMDYVFYKAFGYGYKLYEAYKAKTTVTTSTKVIKATTEVANKISARKDLAEAFYKKVGGDVSEITGINFEKAVQTTTLKKGTVVQQWVRNDGEVGSYFALEGADAAKLGIKTKDRTLRTFELTEDVKVLKSTTKDIAGHKGGEIQLYNPQLKNNIKEIVTQ